MTIYEALSLLAQFSSILLATLALTVSIIVSQQKKK
ncbi:putative holin-like toxin [Alkalihalophilus sp. As8PL]|uniref:Holin-like toxin n=2 Tax=Alkalihalophilus TaxID=2893060 RepID=A0AB39BVP1_9BACI|nr:putative holin-like toxin [Alkalihalophilus lindianensis]MDV2682970.1 putative holin-like toxin [Alkalihalophilus lindianensis]